MQVVQIGDIAESIVSSVKHALTYTEETVLRAIVTEILPEHGIIIEATKEELRDNPELGKVLYHDVEIKVKETEPNEN